MLKSSTSNKEGLTIKLIEQVKKLNLSLILKTGLGSAAAIILANQLNLMYSASAGIITLLTIQNTKKETILIAAKRFSGFIVAVMIAYFIFSNFGYTPLAFGAFLILFVAAANLLRIEVGITMNAVLVSHFLVEGRMDLNLLTNELLLLFIGMGIGILLNSIMPKNIEKIKRNQKVVEDRMRETLSCMAKMLEGSQDCACNQSQKELIDYLNLNELIDSLLVKAYEDAGNTLIRETRYQISYLEMRKHQVRILKDIQESIEEIHDVLPQSLTVSDYIQKVSTEFAEDNNVKDLLFELKELLDFFRSERLPVSRQEFENRANLFVILKDMEQFLEVKKSFIEKY